MSDPLQTLRSQMTQYGIDALSELKVTGKIERFGKKNNSWYALHWFRLDNGNQILTGKFGDWKLGVDEKVDLDMPEMTAEEKKRFAREQRAAAEAAAKAKKEKQAEAARRAVEIWAKLPVEGHSPYLQRKKVAAFGVRFSRGSVVVPE